MPPPPPPAPPPAPTGLPKVPKTKANAGGATDRTALLTSIHSGAKLKKTVTNDRSAPTVANNNKRNEPPSGGMGGGSTGGSAPGGAPAGLGGLFAGGIPKLPNKGNNGPIKRVGGPSVPWKPPGSHGNGKLVNGTSSAPPPPSQCSKPARPVSNINKRRETLENERNLEHNNPVSNSAQWNKGKAQPPPPPSRPAPSHSSSRPTSMVGRPLPPTPHNSAENSAPPGPPRGAPPPPPRQTPSVPPGRPSAPPPPVRTTSAQGGGTVGRSGLGGARPQLPPRQDPPPPPPPHGGHSHSFSSQHAPVSNKHSTSLTSNLPNSSSFDDRFKFHSVQEFPPPEKLNIGLKTYPSHNLRRASTQQRRAPPPPPPR